MIMIFDWLGGWIHNFRSGVQPLGFLFGGEKKEGEMNDKYLKQIEETLKVMSDKEFIENKEDIRYIVTKNKIIKEICIWDQN